jgi:signal peptidase II
MTVPESNANLEMPARRSIKAWLLLLAIVLVGLTADLVTKDWAFVTVTGEPVELVYAEIIDGVNPIPWHEGVGVIPPDLLDLRLVLNRGAVFGIGQGRRVEFVIFTAIAITVAIAVFGWWTRARAHLAHVAIGFILAGGLGNLYDRVAIGAVRDFLHLFPRWELPLGISWPGGTTEVFPWVFNIADVELLLGMGLLLIHVHLSDRQARQASLTAGENSVTTAPDQASEEPAPEE